VLSPANDQIHANSSSFTIRYDPNFSRRVASATC